MIYNIKFEYEKINIKPKLNYLNEFTFIPIKYDNKDFVIQTPKLFIPNTFTPNDDDHNELFRPITSFVSEEGYSFSIYSRSGEEIFNTTNPTKVYIRILCL